MSHGGRVELHVDPLLRTYEYFLCLNDFREPIGEFGVGSGSLYDPGVLLETVVPVSDLVFLGKPTHVPGRFVVRLIKLGTSGYPVV